MPNDDGRSASGKEPDPLGEAARAPLAHRLGGAALFLAAAVIGISALRACRQEKKPPTLPAPAVPSDSQGRMP
ncbi:MAG: hypothetical protein ACKO2G_05475 [Verrucomicrobiales bacterium]